MAHEIRHPDTQTIARTFVAATQVLDEHEVPYLVVGSIAADTHGGENPWPREGTDIDLFLAEEDAKRAQKILGEHGFHVEEPDDDWLVKVYRDGVLVDLIYRAASTIMLDEEMMRRARRRTVEGRQVNVIAPEDYVVIQSRTFGRETPDHLFNALTVLERTTIDWDYLLLRAHDRRDRALALLVWARASGITVPTSVLRRLYEPTFGRE